MSIWDYISPVNFFLNSPQILPSFDHYEFVKVTANLVIFVVGLIWICCFGLLAVIYPISQVTKIVENQSRNESKKLAFSVLYRLHGKPKTQPGKRFLEHTKPKVTKGKKALSIRGISASGTVDCLKDKIQSKKPHTVFFNKKNNDLLPIEDLTKLEYFSQKNDVSLFLMATHNTKRPHNLIMGRISDHRLLDTIELGLEDYIALKDFYVTKVAAGINPCLIFTGEAFEQKENYQHFKNLLIDFFHDEEVSAVNVSVDVHVLMFAALDEKIYLRSCKILLKKFGTSTPKIELEELGPSMALTIKPDLYKSATKQPDSDKGEES